MRRTVRSLSFPAVFLTLAGMSAMADPVFETNIYRFGAAYDHVAAESPTSCAYACQSDDSCLSWSFVRAGVWKDAAVCELKSHIGRPEHNPSAVSGVSPRHEARFDGLKRSWISDDPETSTETLRGAQSAENTNTQRITHIYPGFKAGAAQRTYSASYQTISYETKN